MTLNAKSGIDLTALDPAVRPQDDLYRHVNGRWLASHEIPADRSMDGAFYKLRDLSEERVRAIIEDLGAATDAAPGSTAAKIGDLYRSFMDIEAVNAAGITPIRGNLDRIAGVTSTSELACLLGAFARTGSVSAFDAFVDNDAADPEQYRVYLVQGGLGLPDEAYYREDQHAEIRAKYVGHIARMLTLGSVVPATRIATPTDGAVPITEAGTKAAQRVMTLETKLAGHHWDVVKNRDATLTYNPTTLAGMAEMAPEFNWVGFADALGMPTIARDALVAAEPSFFEGFAQLWASEPLDDWKLWAQFHLISSSAPYLTDAIVEANFDFYGRTLSGTPELRERWKRGVALVEGALGEAVGEQYVARHFPPTHKAKMDELVANLVEAYRKSIESLDWMTPETKVKALDKLGKFTPKIGYPVKWRDYSGLHIKTGDLLGNVARANEFATEYELAKVGKPLDRDEWFMTPQTVNAYYNPGMNEIVFPAAILQPPFFDPEADDAVNYGGIGGVIGHEIGHGFDDQGSKYDGDGALIDWWTAEDRAEFEARTKALIAQYDALVPVQLGPDGVHVNGALTIGENIGDLGGLSIAIKAYRIAIAKASSNPAATLADAPVIDGLTGLERLFLGWAQVWQSKGRDEELQQRIATDPHSPAEFRCNQVLKNVDEFHATYVTGPDDALWLAPEDRVRIW